ncbi:MAG: putative addiction module antidote protein [Candidatus Omnitrophica bacterium]|nr:putative addiction module antidote protein [Candidatus Omnitrophota bacterium]
MTIEPERKYPAAAPYEETLYQELQDKDFAIAYLNECLQDEEDLSVFLLALKHVIEAQDIKMTELAKKSGLNRESLYKMLSQKGNPELKSIRAVLSGLGLRITIAG